MHICNQVGDIELRNWRNKGKDNVPVMSCGQTDESQIAELSIKSTLQNQEIKSI
jgi:hypothetical protein